VPYGASMRDRAKYLAEQRRYNRSAKGQARRERWEAARIRVPAYLGGTRYGDPRRIVPRTPENEAAVERIAGMIAEKKARMSAEWEAFNAELDAVRPDERAEFDAALIRTLSVEAVMSGREREHLGG
jgi:hypothetical protein